MRSSSLVVAAALILAAGANALSATAAPALSASAAPRRIILFDVLDTLVVDPFFQGMHKEVFGFESLEALYGSTDREAYEAFETGAIGEAELWRRYYKDGTAPPDGAAAVAFLEANYDYVRCMRSLLGEIKRIGDVEVHALSNYGPYWRNIEAKLELSRYLDWSFVSCETGLRKPDPRAFEDALAKLGAAVGRDTVVFVDDNEVNCDAAAKLGLSTIHFLGDSADCRTELIALGFTELRV